jgi:hypothetical protein
LKAGLPKHPPPRSRSPNRSLSGSVLELRSPPCSGLLEPRSRPVFRTPYLFPKLQAPAHSWSASPHAFEPTGPTPDPPKPRSQSTPRPRRVLPDFWPKKVFFFLALWVGPRAFLGLERGDKAQSLPLLPHCFIFELEWRGKELLVLAWCWCWSKVGELEEDL